MKFIKEYKGIMIMFLIITIVNVIWVTSYDNSKIVNTVNKEKTIALNA